MKVGQGKNDESQKPKAKNEGRGQAKHSLLLLKFMFAAPSL
jgi:hypothetical protein